MKTLLFWGFLLYNHEMSAINSISYAKAFWLVHHTALSFQQIAHYCDLLTIEVQAIADGASKMTSSGYNLVELGELSKEDIARCEADPAERLPKEEKPVKARRNVARAKKEAD